MSHWPITRNIADCQIIWEEIFDFRGNFGDKEEILKFYNLNFKYFNMIFFWVKRRFSKNNPNCSYKKNVSVVISNCC